MPKATRRRKGTGKNSNAGQARTSTAAGQGPSGQAQTADGAKMAGTPRANRAFISPPVRGPQSLLWPFMGALGCWGLTISYLFFSSDPNHILYAGMVTLLSLVWTFSFGVRLRKLLQQRSRA